MHAQDILELEGGVMERFVNLTPHVLTVRLDDGQVVCIPSSGRVARCRVERFVEREHAGIPIAVTRHVCYLDTVPGPEEGVLYIVSTMVAHLLGDRPDVVAPDTGPDCIRGPDHRIEGVRRLTRFEKERKG